ncbi:MAG: hydrogenase nickel incorporation protein HypB [Verrucomicrobiota bacterium]
MCATCGCSDSDWITITDMQTGKHVHLDRGHFSVPKGDVHSHDSPSVHPSPGHEDHAHAGHEHVHDLHEEHEHAHAPHARSSSVIRVEAELLARNRLIAERNRGWFRGREIFALNLMSAPGAGKTTLLERTIRDLKDQLAFHVIEGDQATTCDAQRISATGCRVIQINTGAACHLDARMVEAALGQLKPGLGSIVIIENVGNLVCPALFDLGEEKRVLLASVTEGDDKPIKYPHMFRAADLVLMTKADLIPHVPFAVERFSEHLRQVNPHAQLISLSATQGDGLQPWYDWLRKHGNSAGQ